MADDIVQIEKVSTSTKNAIARKSAQTLPNRPSEMGYSPAEIKRRFFQLVLDAQNSALAEIDRVIEGINGGFIQVSDFINEAALNPPYKSDLGAGAWAWNETTKRYEYVIDKDMHRIEDYKEISVDMYLIDSDGKLINVNNYDIYTDCRVVLYNDNTGGGFVSISRNRDGYIKADVVTDVDNIENIATVAKTNDYNDLDNKPDISSALNNSVLIARIISGEQVVGSAQSATSAGSAGFANTAGNATTANSATTATKAEQDAAGDNIIATYAKRNGTYADLTAGKAIADSDGNKILDTYAKKVEIGGVYDRIIRTQAEFDELVAASGANSWNVPDNNIRSVAFVGDGGTLAFTKASTVTIPPTVQNLKGFNSASIKVTSGNGLGYATRPALNAAYSISDLSVSSGRSFTFGGGEVHGFFNCINLVNCSAHVSGMAADSSTSVTISAFYRCENLVNCVGNASGSQRILPSTALGTPISFGFRECTNLINCVGRAWGGVGSNQEPTPSGSFEARGFSSCDILVGCRAETAFDPPTSTGTGYGFASCNYTSCCTAYGTNVTALWLTPKAQGKTDSDQQS